MIQNHSTHLRLRSLRTPVLTSLHGLILALALLIATAAHAQNPMLHIGSTSNISLDYMPLTNEYLLDHQAQPLLINGMNNQHFSTGTGLNRIQLEVIPDNFTPLASTISKTYCTVAEVNDYMQGTCGSLSNFFYTFDARQTADHGFIICGRSDRTSEFSNCAGPSYMDAFLLKTDSRGVPVWYKRYRPQMGGSFWFNTVTEDAITGTIIVGGQSPTGNAFIMGTDGTGTVLWQHDIKADQATSQPYMLPSSFTKVASYVSRANQQLYVLTGPAIVHYNGVNYNAYYGGGMLTLVDAGGVLHQNVQLTQDLNSNYMKTEGVADAHDGDIVLTGCSGGTYCGQHDDWDMMLMKIDPITLTQRFMKIYQSGSTGTCTTGSCTIGSAGNGNAVVVPSRGGNIYVAGSEVVYNSAAGAAFMETDNMGNLQRFLPHSTSNGWMSKGIVYNSTGGYVAYSGTAPNVKSFLVKNKYGSDGCDPDTNPDVTETTFDFIPNHDSTISIITLNDQMQAFNLADVITRPCGAVNKNAPTAVQSLTRGEALSIVPNPATDFVNMQLPLSLADGTATIYDVHGRMVQSLNFAKADQSVRMSTTDLAPGLYMVNMQGNGKAFHTSFVKQ